MVVDTLRGCEYRRSLGRNMIFRVKKGVFAEKRRKSDILSDFTDISTGKLTETHEGRINFNI